ncbi:MAG: hypothetical protein KDD70_07515 [Bdellovibrionales bacterium]|nr:hypothetical protein [Bdellovibrionales bacterium]
MRDFLLIVFGFFVIFAIFKGTLLALERVAEFSTLAYLPPKVPLAMLLLFLFVMLVLSCAVITLGAFFLSLDNQLILAAPVSRAKYFSAKLYSVILSAIWMPLSFIFPFLLAFGFHYEGDLYYYLSWFLVLPPYFLIPAAFSVVLSHIIITLIPPSQTRVLLGVVLVGVVALLMKLGAIISSGLQEQQNVEQLLRILTIVSLPDVHWLPPQWAALTLDALLEKDYGRVAAPLGLLWSTSIGLIALAYGTFTVLFPIAYSRSSNRRRYVPPFFRFQWGRSLRKFIPLPSVTLMLKDYKMLYRDMPQIIQLLLLLSIYIIYVYNLRVLGLVEIVEKGDRSTWVAFFFITNASMGAFITTAAATRLVFPSVSLEGKSFWILQTAPIPLVDILKNKFWTWFPLIGTLASITFTAGNVALGASPVVMVSTFCVGWFLSAGIIALGLAIGAVFARFDWEHSAQLVASFGSFVFMLSSIFLIVLNMMPLGIALYIREPGMLGEHLSDSSWLFIVSCCTAFIVFINVLVISVSFDTGKRALLAQSGE